MATSDANGIFAGVRFILSGFDSISKYRFELIQKGGVDLGKMYDPSCTHLIVSGRLYDDPVCILARSEGKIVVNETWIYDSLDLGILADPNRVLYRPVKDINGIPGCESLHICLTGYQKQDRNDIMRMVDLMGARFSKPLIANQVTHLICYKFEGQKYELAKKVNIKLVNHLWIEDCLKAWKIQPIDNYTKSGYELEIMDATEHLMHAPNKNDCAFNARTRSKSKSPLIKTPLITPLINSDQSETKYEAKEYSCETQLNHIISNISPASSVSSNKTTVKKLSKKSVSPVEQSSSNSVNFTPQKRKICEEYNSIIEEKNEEGNNVQVTNLVKVLYSKLFSFVKKINLPS